MWTRVPGPREIANVCGRVVRRALPTIAATTAITLVGTGVWAGYQFITTSERFAIRSIEIHGEAHLTEAQVRAAMSVQLGDNVFATNLDAVTRELRDTPWIATASAHRVLPDTLVVKIHEHAAAALVDLGGLYLVDTSGHPFKRAQVAAGDGAGLPVITGLGRDAYEREPADTAGLVIRALDALTQWQLEPTRPTIGELRVDRHRTLTLRTYDHAISIELGPLEGPDEGSLAARMRMFDAAWNELSDPERARARALHLDARRDQASVAFHPAAPAKE